MENNFQIPLIKSYAEESEQFVYNLMADKKLQSAFIQNSSDTGSFELRVLNWLNTESFLESIAHKDYQEIANLLFSQNDIVKRVYKSSEDKPEPRGALAVAVVGVAGLFIVAAALATEIVSNTNRYLATTTKFWGARSTALTKLTFNSDQKALITALNVTTDSNFVNNVIENYNQLLQKLSTELNNATSCKSAPNLVQ